MQFQHDTALTSEFPQLVVGTIWVDNVETLSTPPVAVATLLDRARVRLDGRPESEWPEIMAWRRAFSHLGVKPTQYRCASESLLRRLRTAGTLPAIHPLVDLCNAASGAYGIPIAVFDREAVVGNLTVRRATGSERYVAFDATEENPEPGEVVFADEAGNAHSRRWTHRQSALSSIRRTTRSVLIVIEALHDGAADDVTSLVAELREAIPDPAVTWLSP